MHKWEYIPSKQWKKALTKLDNLLTKLLRQRHRKARKAKMILAAYDEKIDEIDRLLDKMCSGTVKLSEWQRIQAILGE